MIRENIQALKWLFHLSRRNRPLLFLSMALAALSGGMGLLPLFVIYLLSLSMIQGKPLPEPFWQLPALALGAVGLKYLLLFCSTLLSHTAAFRIHYQLRRDLVDHMGRLPMGFFTQRSSGMIRKIMGEDIEKLEIFIGHHVPDTATALAVPVIVIGVLLAFDPLLSISVLLPLLLAALALILMYRSQNRKVKEYHDNTEKMNTAVVEYIKAMPVVKIFNLTVDSYRRLSDAIARQVQITGEWIRTTTPAYALFRISIDSALLFLMPCAVFIAATGQLNLSQWLLFFLLAMGMTGPLGQIYTSSNLLSSLMEGARRVDTLLAARTLPGAQRPATPERFDIRFEDVEFAYGDTLALKGVSMTLAQGRVHAFVGESGSGKTTAASLLARFWDVAGGRITIGGKDIRDIPLDVLMSKVSFVFQDVFIPEGTVTENIGLGRPGAPVKDIRAAARAAQAHNFIEGLDKGYDTVIGAGGVHLSGGERQRIAIARALLKDAPILILDEATASTDPENAFDISKNLENLAADKTMILITHRLSTVTHADQILVFNRGRLTGAGSHDTLLDGNRDYLRMWDKTQQAGNWVLAARKV
jgi:ATP-binding cassette subfamily B protein